MTFRLRFELQWFPHLFDIEAPTIEEAVSELRNTFNSPTITSIEIITPGTPSQAKQDQDNTFVWIGNQWQGSWQKKQTKD